MMDYERQLKLQAYLDSELPEGGRRAVESWLAQGAEAKALLAELRQTNAALAGFESEIKLPESREFFWSKIEREIRRQEQAPRAEVEPSWLFAWRRFLIPASALAMLAVLLVSLQMSSRGAASASGIVAAFDDESAFTYRDQSQGTTLVWLSYAAEDKFTGEESEETIQD
jgi:anti-sigma factor RsiW